MRQNRVKLPNGVYHCISRVVAGERLLGAVEQEVMRKMLWKAAMFSGVEVLAFCIMSNHVHLLVRVREPDDRQLTRAELLRRYRALYGDGQSPHMPDPAALELLFRDPDSAEAARWETRLRARMHDVSEFMKTLNQRFTIWYNHTHKRFGTFWAERFKSTLVQDAPEVLAIVAAYIDLNPVRAGLVKDPADFRFSSYGEAMGGGCQARKGLASALGRRTWAATARDYRLLLFGKGANARVGEQAEIPHETVMAVIQGGGKVTSAQLIRCRVRYFSDGLALGSKAFVLEVASGFKQRRGRKSVQRRNPDQLPLADLDELVTLRSGRGPRVL